MDSPFNRNARLPNVFYFDEDNFNNVLEQVDSISIPRNSPELNLNNTKALQLVKTIENLF